MKLERFVETWGTVIVVQAASTGLSADELGLAVDRVEEFFYKVDKHFSTYKSDSEVSRIRRGELEVADASENVKEVWKLCEHARELTLGAFDPWIVDGGFDPSGLVKGWAADKCADMLVAVGAEHVQVNAAGDLALRGGWFDAAAEMIKPWSIGVVNPDNRMEVVKVYEITDGAIATSGTYERGAHIHDPHNGLIAIGAASATVVGAAGWLCDAMATAVMVGGADSARWFGQPELQGYQVFAVNRHDATAWEI